MSEHPVYYRGVEVPDRLLIGLLDHWKNGVDAALESVRQEESDNNPRLFMSDSQVRLGIDALDASEQALLQAKPRVFQDPTEDLWFETSPGYFTHGMTREDAISRADSMPFVNSMRERESACFINWAEHVLREYYANDFDSLGNRGVRDVTSEH